MNRMKILHRYLSVISLAAPVLVAGMPSSCSEGDGEKSKAKKGFADCKNPSCHSYAEMLMSSKKKLDGKPLYVTVEDIKDTHMASQRSVDCPVDKDELGDD